MFVCAVVIPETIVVESEDWKDLADNSADVGVDVSVTKSPFPKTGVMLKFTPTSRYSKLVFVEVCRQIGRLDDRSDVRDISADEDGRILVVLRKDFWVHHNGASPHRSARR